ncbi:unnamed protein product [Fusarium graminearum]|nr:unnamed protein product [Fusarium graminearum]
MRFAAIVSFLLPLVAAKPAQKGKTFSNVEIFDPPTNYRDPQVLYARPLELSDGTLLGTWENYSPEPPNTWKEISKVKDTQNNWGLRYQPQLYELPRAFGKYPKGTVLCSGSSIPSDLSETLIEVYASRDKGYTWEFVSHVALGGEALPNPGLTPVWEPFLMTYKEKLILYYSDQRDNATHSQKLVHQTTTDLKKWSKVVDDTKYADYYARPGMPTVAKLPNNEYIYVYDDYWFPVYYRLSKDPQKFLNKAHHQIVSNDGTTPAGSPYVVWTPYGGKNGTIVVSCGTRSEIFTNQALGDASAWKKSEIEQELCKIKPYIRGIKQRAREIIDEIKIYQKDVPREYWKDMDQLRSALKEIKRELEKLTTLKRRLRYEAKELRKEEIATNSHYNQTSLYLTMNHPRRIERVSRVIKGSRTSSSPVNDQRLQLIKPLTFTHYSQAKPQSAQVENAYPQRVEYVYLYTVEMKREVASIAAETQAIKTDYRFRVARLQRDIAQMQRRLDQMERSKA